MSLELLKDCKLNEAEQTNFDFDVFVNGGEISLNELKIGNQNDVNIQQIKELDNLEVYPPKREYNVYMHKLIKSYIEFNETENIGRQLVNFNDDFKFIQSSNDITMVKEEMWDIDDKGLEQYTDMLKDQIENRKCNRNIQDTIDQFFIQKLYNKQNTA